MSFFDLSKSMLFPTLLFAGTCMAAESYPAPLISDPEALQARGFDPHGAPLYDLKVPEDSRPLDLRIEERELFEAARAPAEHGGFGVNWVSVQATDFQFLNDQNEYTTIGNHELQVGSAGPNRFADAPIHLADDRRLRFLDVWTRDTSAAHDVDVVLYQVCQPLFSGGLPSVAELAMVEGTGNPGPNFNFSFIAAVYPQNSVCAFWVRAMFSSPAAGGDVSLLKVRVIWE